MFLMAKTNLHYSLKSRIKEALAISSETGQELLMIEKLPSDFGIGTSALFPISLLLFLLAVGLLALATNLAMLMY